MPYPVRVHPIFYNRLSFAVEHFELPLEVELEVAGRHLSEIEHEFATRWDELAEDPGDPRARLVDGHFSVADAIFVVRARMEDDGVVSIRDIEFVAW